MMKKGSYSIVALLLAAVMLFAATPVYAGADNGDNVKEVQACSQAEDGDHICGAECVDISGEEDSENKKIEGQDNLQKDVPVADENSGLPDKADNKQPPVGDDITSGSDTANVGEPPETEAEQPSVVIEPATQSVADAAQSASEDVPADDSASDVSENEGAVAQALFAPAAAGDIPLEAPYFDTEMMAVLAAYDTDSDNILSAAEIAAITSLAVVTNEMPMGLEYLTALTELTLTIDALHGTDFAGYSGPAPCLNGFGHTNLAAPFSYDTATSWITSTDKTKTSYTFLYGNISVALALSYAPAKTDGYFHPDDIELPINTGRNIAIDLGDYEHATLGYDSKFVTVLNGSTAGVTQITASSNLTVWGKNLTQGQSNAEYGVDDAVVLVLTFSGNGLPDKTHGVRVKVTGDPNHEYTLTLSSEVTSSHTVAKAGEVVTLTCNSPGTFGSWQIDRTNNRNIPLDITYVKTPNSLSGAVGPQYATASFIMPMCDISISTNVKIVPVAPEGPDIDSLVDSLANKDNDRITDSDQDIVININVVLEEANDEMQTEFDKLMEQIFGLKMPGLYESLIQEILNIYRDADSDFNDGDEEKDGRKATEDEYQYVDDEWHHFINPIYAIGYFLYHDVDGWMTKWRNRKSAASRGQLAPMSFTAEIDDSMILLAGGTQGVDYEQRGDEQAEEMFKLLDENIDQAVLKLMPEGEVPVQLRPFIANYILPLAAYPELFSVPNATSLPELANGSSDGTTLEEYIDEYLEEHGDEAVDTDNLFAAMLEEMLEQGDYATDEEAAAAIEEVKDYYMEFVDALIETLSETATAGAFASELVGQSGLGGDADERWQALEDMGVTEGMDAGDELTREDVCLMLYRVAGSPEVNTTKTDAAILDKTSDGAKDAVAWCLQNGIVPEADESFDPREKVSCGEATAYIKGFFEAAKPSWVAGDNLGLEPLSVAAVPDDFPKSYLAI